MRRVAQLLDAANEKLKAAGADEPRRDARLLLASILKVDQAALIARDDQAVTQDQERRFLGLIDRRAAREPVSRILGRRGFWTLDLQVTPDTLDPRPDTETVVEAVLAALPDRQAPLRVLDLGTGTGCLLLALLSELPNAIGVGVDRAAGAAMTARANAVASGLARRAHVVVGDWVGPLAGPFNVVVANPPYIERNQVSRLMPEVARFDPVLALDGGPDGLDAYRAILKDLPRVLAPGAIVAFEIGAGQGDSVATLMRLAHLEVRMRRSDLAGIERCILATGGQNHHSRVAAS